MAKITKYSNWNRKCIKCSSILYYSSKRNLQRAIDNNSVCRNCRIMPESMKKALSEYWTGRKRPNYPKHRLFTKFSEWTRPCPNCGDPLYYSSAGYLKNAENEKTVCNKCSAYKYKKNWKYVIGEKEIKQMRAAKAGFKDWKEYKEKYPAKKLYQNEVRRLTASQPLHLLKDYKLWNENKGLCGTTGAYQLDHIISIDIGWNSKILPEIIANIKNLQILPWKENRSKGN